MGYGAWLFALLTSCFLCRGVLGFPSFPPQPPLLLSVWTCHASPTANCTPRDTLRRVSPWDPVPRMLHGLNTPHLCCLLFLSLVPPAPPRVLASPKIKKKIRKLRSAEMERQEPLQGPRRHAELLVLQHLPWLCRSSLGHGSSPCAPTHAELRPVGNQDAALQCERWRC